MSANPGWALGYIPTAGEWNGLWGMKCDADDARVVGALQAGHNLSDLQNAASARANLGLGGAATASIPAASLIGGTGTAFSSVSLGAGVTLSSGTLSVIYGTTSGTAAAGNDSRILNALPASVAAATYAPLISPALSGTPTAPTAAAGTGTTQIATTAFVTTEIGALTTGVSMVNGRGGAVTLTSSDITSALAFTPYSAANPAGYITASGAPVQSVAGRTGAVTLAVGDVSGAAPKASPLFTGTVTLPAGSTSAPPTKFQAGSLLSIPVAHSMEWDGSALYLTNSSGTRGTVATQSWVQGLGYVTAATAPVTSVFGRTGAVTLGSSDVATALGFTPYSAANPAGYQTAAQVSAVVPAASSTAPVMVSAAAAVGTGTTFARADHSHPSDTPAVSTIAALRLVTTTTLPASRCAALGYSSIGDGGEGWFTYNSGDTTSADNGGTIIVDASGRRWYRDTARAGATNVLWFGAKGDGSTNDSSAIQAAIQATFTKGGGDVLIPATGHAFVIGAGITLPSGVNLIGSGQPAWIGADQPWNLWPSTGGAWLQPTDTTNPAITVSGVGCKVRGLNFIHNQPAPSSTPGTTYVPTVYPYCIRVTQNFVGLEDIHIVNATHGIAWDYTSTSGGGTYCYMRNIFSGALQVGAWFHNVNDTMHISNVHERNLFYCDNSNIQTYTETHKWGWHFNYIDNPMIDGVEFFQCAVAIQGTDSTVNAGGFNLTHACVLAQMTNVDFNLCVQAINLANNTTTFTGFMTNVIAQSDTVTNRAAGYFFNLASDNANLIVSNLWVPQVGNSLMAIGGGNSGLVQINNMRVDWYGSLGNNSPCFNVGASAFLDCPTGMQNVVRKFGAGAKVTGSGAVQSSLAHSNVYADREGGTVGLVASSAGDDYSGYVGFFNTGSTTRRGYVGHSSPTTQELNVVADSGPVYITNPGGTWQHNVDGSTVFLNSSGVKKWKIDASGNMVLAGILTQSGTP